MSISLESAIKTCKVSTAWANRVESSRFLDPNQMVCPIWNGMDTAGRQVCPDSFMTKRAGCNSAEDRVSVENNVVRPQYMEYINLSSQGVAGNIYGNTMPWKNSHMRTQDLNKINHITGNFGSQFGASVYPSCGYAPYKDAMAQENQHNRQGQGLQHGYAGSSRRTAAGF
jgi:hypothetical protein